MLDGNGQNNISTDNNSITSDKPQNTTKLLVGQNYNVTSSSNANNIIEDSPDEPEGSGQEITSEKNELSNGNQNAPQTTLTSDEPQSTTKPLKIQESYIQIENILQQHNTTLKMR
jgi:hypothetical protein